MENGTQNAADGRRGGNICFQAPKLPRRPRMLVVES